MSTREALPDVQACEGEAMTKKPHLIGSCGDLDQMRSLIRGYFHLAPDVDPLIPTPDVMRYDVRSGRYPDGHEGLRVIIKGRRARFEDTR